MNASRFDAIDLLAEEIAGSRPRSLGSHALGATGLDRVRKLSDNAIGTAPAARATAPLASLLVDPHIHPARPVYFEPRAYTSGLLGVVSLVDGLDPTASVQPFTIGYTNAAAAHTEGSDSTKAESALTYTAGQVTHLATIAHQIPVTTKTLRYNAALRVLIDQFLANGLLVKVDAAVVTAMAAVAQPFEATGNTATDIRLAIAAAQSALPELGGSEVAVVLSPNDHAALDLSAKNLSEWPARIVSTPAVSDGAGFVGRLRQGVQVHATDIDISIGRVGDQFVQNRATVLAEIDALPVAVAPGLVFQLVDEES